MSKNQNKPASQPTNRPSKPVGIQEKSLSYSNSPNKPQGKPTTTNSSTTPAPSQKK